MNNSRTFRNLDGDEITVSYCPLTRMKSIEIEYDSIGLIMGAMSSAAAHLFKEVEKVSELQSYTNIAQAIDAVYKAIPFSKLREIGQEILRGCVIQGVSSGGQVDDLDDCDYFTDRLDEFVLAIFWGLDVSFPRTFTKAREFLARLGVNLPGEEVTTESSTSKKSSTQSALSQRSSLL